MFKFSFVEIKTQKIQAPGKLYHVTAYSALNGDRASMVFADTPEKDALDEQQNNRESKNVEKKYEGKSKESAEEDFDRIK